MDRLRLLTFKHSNHPISKAAVYALHIEPHVPNIQISNSYSLLRQVPTQEYTLSRYFLISAQPLFLASSVRMGIFMSICEYTLISIPSATSTILVAVSSISPRTLPSCSLQEGSVVQMVQCSWYLLKVCLTQQKSRAETMRIFLQARQMTLVFWPMTSSSFLYWSMLLSNFRCSWKSLEMDSQVSRSVGNLKKQTKMLVLPCGQQYSLSLQSVAGQYSLLPSAGTQNTLASLVSFSLKRWQQGWDSLITSLQSLAEGYYFNSFYSSSWECSDLRAKVSGSVGYLECGGWVSAAASRQVLSLPEISGSALAGCPRRWSSSRWSLRVMNLFCSSLGREQLRGSFLMRQEQRQRRARSHKLYMRLLKSLFVRNSLLQFTPSSEICQSGMRGGGLSESVPVNCPWGPLVNFMVFWINLINRRIVSLRMLSSKSIKYIHALKTQKMIREEIQKQDFFQNLLTEIQHQFRPEEYQYLTSFVIPRKHESKDRRRPQFQSQNNYFSSESKDNTCALIHSRKESFRTFKNIKSIKSFKKMNTECSDDLPLDFEDPNIVYEIKKVKRKAHFAPKQSSNEQNNEKDGKSMAKVGSLKFKQILLDDRGSMSFKNFCSLKLSKRSQRSLKENLMSQPKIKRNYKDHFLNEMMESRTNDQVKNRLKSSDFDETPLLRKTHYPQNEFWEREKEQEKKFLNLTSTIFQKSQKTSRAGLRIYTRKF